MHHPSSLPLLSTILLLLIATPSTSQGTMCRNQPPYTNCASSVIATVTLPCEAHTSADVAYATACKCSTLSQIFDCYTSLCPPDNLNDVFTTQFNSYGCPNAPPLGGGTKTKKVTVTTGTTSARATGMGGGSGKEAGAGTGKGTVTATAGDPGAVNTAVGKSGAGVRKAGATGGDVFGLVVGGLVGGAILLGAV